MQNVLQQYRLLLTDYLKPQWKRVLGLAIALLTSIALQIINPQILGYFIDTAVRGGSQQALLTATIAINAIVLSTEEYRHLWRSGNSQISYPDPNDSGEQINVCPTQLGRSCERWVQFGGISLLIVEFINEVYLSLSKLSALCK